jgi:hypothetical protein
MTPDTAHFVGVLFASIISAIAVLALGLLIASRVHRDLHPDAPVTEVVGAGEETTSWLRGRTVVDADGVYGRHSATAVRR